MLVTGRPLIVVGMVIATGFSGQANRVIVILPLLVLYVKSCALSAFGKTRVIDINTGEVACATDEKFTFMGYAWKPEPSTSYQRKGWKSIGNRPKKQNLQIETLLTGN